MKIFNNNLKKHIRTVNLKPKEVVVNNMKYLPAFSKEWKNIIYSFNKNNMKNLSANTVNINKIIKSYFNLYFKDRKFLGRTKFVYLKKRRNFLKRIFVSDANIKYTNQKAKITLYTINKEKKALKRKYHKLNNKISYKLFKGYTLLYSFYLKAINSILSKEYEIHDSYFFIRDFVKKKNYIKHTFKYLNAFLRLNHLFLKKMWNELLKNRAGKYFRYLRKYSLLYSLNQFKFNKVRLLSKLTYLLEQIIGKKIQYNIVNLKSITHHPDIFTDLLALKVKKDRMNPRKRIQSVLHKARILKKNRIQERSKAQKPDKIDFFRNKYRDLKIISHINQENSDLSKLLNNILKEIYLNSNASRKENILLSQNKDKNIHNLIFNSIGYKHLSGIKLKISGRLTKRYRADRAVQVLKWKGGLKNVDSSFKGLSSVSFRGNTNSNVSYSWSKSKRRIGSFAVKGWIGGK
jgi:hypothetical protein